MSLSNSIFALPFFRPEWILYEDEYLIAVHKEPGIPCQAAEEDKPDDLVFRLRRFLANRDERAPEDVYLGIHQRLDRSTSGVLLYAKSKDANPSLAKQFEGRTVRKEYVAGVCGFSGPNSRKLVHHLARDKGRGSRIVKPSERGAKRAVSHVSLLERNGQRALLAVRIETGRTHQIRVQLASEGFAVAGDDEYGSDSAPRLMLHARVLELEHPITAAQLRLESPVPPSFTAWLAGTAGSNDLRIAVDTAFESRWGLLRDPNTNAFRLANGAGDGIDGLCIDIYGDYLVLNFYDDAMRDRQPEIVHILAGYNPTGIYAKYRPKQANTLVESRDEDVAPAAPVWGEPAPEPFSVRENGLPYLVKLGDGLSTGIFLDQRLNRARVQRWARQANVLNLFAYTCPFSVAAVHGDAKHVTSVDVSQGSLDWGKANLGNRLDPEKHVFLRQDVFAALAMFKKQDRVFDLVVVDPPTYSKTKRSRFRSKSDWVKLAQACMDVTTSGGRILATSNDHRMTQRTFRRYLKDAAKRSGRSLTALRDHRVPRDFPSSPGDPEHLKTLEAILDAGP